VAAYAATPPDEPHRCIVAAYVATPPD
jgi:hypothetical protein